jgi:hypothetical protein
MTSPSAWPPRTPPGAPNPSTASSPASTFIADQNDPHGLTAERAVPETDHFGDLHGIGTPVPANPGVTPQRLDRGVGAMSVGVPNRGPRVRGRPDRPVRGGGSSCSTEVTFNLLVQLIRLCRLRRRFPT